MKTRTLLTLCGLFLVMWPARPVSGAETRLHVEPAEIAVGMFYDGTDVQVEATVEAGTDVAVLCAGKEQTVELKKKGKVWGILWMNVGEVTLERVPSLYVLSSSRPLQELTHPENLARLGLGYRALASRVSSPGGADGSFRELVKLRESEGLYSVSEGGVRSDPVEGGGEHMVTECRLPARAPPGYYEISLYGFRQGEGRLLATENLKVSQAGMALLTSTLASQHGLLYGIMAVVIALAIGLLTGLALGRLSRKGH